MSATGANGPSRSQSPASSGTLRPSYPGGELEALGHSPNYYRWFLRHFGPYLGARVLEIGPGIGTVADHLLRNTGVAELILVEPADNLFPRLAGRWPGDRRVTLVHGRLEDVADSVSVDSVIAVNVLEHVVDDVGLLRSAHRV